jgi:hypothetical protein
MRGRSGSALALAAIFLSSAMTLISGAADAAETREEAVVVRDVAARTPLAMERLSATADRIRMVMSAERAALGTLATDRAFADGAALDGPGGIPADRSRLDGAPDLDPLRDEDALAAELARSGAGAMAEALLLGDAALAVDLSKIERLADRQGDRQWRCLAEAIYFEARGESLAGQMAVGEVVLNRVDSARFPSSVCEVVSQGAGGDLHRCQFSYECDGVPEVITERDSFGVAGKIAWLLLEGRPRVLTDGATFYHATYVSPRWARRFVRSARIGEHIFYRPPTRVSSN